MSDKAGQGNWKTSVGWLKYLCQSSDKTLTQLFQKDPELIRKTVNLVCLSPNRRTCFCSYKFESLSIINNDFDGLCSLVSNGTCPHVKTIKKDKVSEEDDQEVQTCGMAIADENEKSTRDRDASDSDQHQGSSESRLLFLAPHVCASMSASGQNTEESDIDLTKGFVFEEDGTFVEDSAFREESILEAEILVTAKVRAVHVAAAQGRAKLVKKILCLTKQFENQRIHSSTEIFKFLPLHQAVVHDHMAVVRFVLKCDICSDMIDYQIVNYASHAISQDNVLLLKLFIQFLNIRNPDCLKFVVLLMAVKLKSYKVLRYVVDRGANICHLHYCYAYLPRCCNLWNGKKEVLKNMILRNDLHVMKTIVRNKKVKLDQILSPAVFYDNVEIAELIIHTAKRRKIPLSIRTGRWSQKDSLLIRATLNNSPRMLQVLLKGKLQNQFFTYNSYSARTWAVVLGFRECADILKNASVPFDENDLKKLPPTVAVFHKHADSHRNDKSTLIDIILRKGWTFTCESANAITPLNMVLQHGAYRYIHRLLIDGVDPYLGRNCLRNYISKEFLVALLYANVDIFRSRPDLSLVSQILFSSTAYQTDLGFLLRHAHTVPDIEKKRLASLDESSVVSDTVKREIHNFLTLPKSLQDLSRNTIRRHCGIKIFNFIEGHIPRFSQKVKRILTMEENLCQFLNIECEETSLRNIFEITKDRSNRRGFCQLIMANC